MPPLKIERSQLRCVLGDSILDTPVTQVALVFTGSTMAELEREAAFDTLTASSPPSGVLHEAVDWLTDGSSQREMRPTLMSGLLDGMVNGFFYAQVRRKVQIADPRIPPVTVQVNSEGHRLLMQLLPGQVEAGQKVGADVANSLAFRRVTVMSGCRKDSRSSPVCGTCS